MCQKACLPAPKTTTSCTFARFLKSMVLASAVRKAVISSAFMRARGPPERSSSARRPLGVVLSLLAMLEGGGEAVVELEVLAERERESKEAREPRAEEVLPFEEDGSDSVTIFNAIMSA